MNFPNKLRPLFSGDVARKYWLVAGLILAIVGQSMMREPQPLTAFKTMSELASKWNETLYLGLKNPVNIIAGLFFIALASMIYSQLFRSANMQELYIFEGNWLSWKKFLPWIITSLSAYVLVMFQIARHQYSAFLFGIWLICIFIFTLIFWKNENLNTSGKSLSITYLDGAWILALFAFAIAAGSYLLNDLPAGWAADEGQFWKIARGIALGEKSPPFFDFGVFSFPVSSSILQGWIMRWAGIDMWGWRFASVLPAAITVIPLYLLARELFDRRVAIAANVMMISNPYFLTFARLGYNNSQSLFPVTLCVYFLVLGIRKNSYYYLWLAGLTAGLGFYTYFAAWLGLVVLFIVMIGLALIHRIKFSKNIIPLTIIFAGALVVILPRVLYGLSGDSANLLHFKVWETGPINIFYGTSIFGEERISQTNIHMLDDQVGIFYDPSLYGVLLLRGIVRSTAVLFDPIGYSDHQIIFGLAGPGSSLFFILGLGISLANFKKTQYLIPSTWFLGGFFFLGALASIPPRPTHMVAIIPVMSFIAGIGLISFVDAMLSTNPSKLERMLHWKKTVTLSVSLLIIASMGFIQYFFLTPYAYFSPNADDYISWLGRQIPHPATIYLVNHYSTVRNPKDEGLLKLTQHRVLFLTRAKLESNPGQMESWENFAAFIDPKEGREYASWIAQKIPGASVQAAYVPGKRLRGYIITDLDINTTMDISPTHGLRDLWDSPARTILVSCGLGIIALLLSRKAVKRSGSNEIEETT